MIPLATREAQAELYELGEGYLADAGRYSGFQPCSSAVAPLPSPYRAVASLHPLTPSWAFQQGADLPAHCRLVAGHGHGCFLSLLC